MKNLKKIARDAANVAGQNLTFDPFSIIALFLPLILQCFQRQEPDNDPLEALREEYNPNTGEFSPKLIRRARPQMRQAIRLDARNKGKLVRRKSLTELDMLIEESFLQALEQNENVVAKAISEGLAVQFSEEDTLLLTQVSSVEDANTEQE